VSSKLLSDTTSAQQFNQADAASRRGLFQALGPLLSKIASFVDNRLIRGALFAVLVVACVLLGSLAALLIAIGPREPALMALGLGGLVGLLGASVRLWLGPRFFHAPRRLRLLAASSLALGSCAAILAAFALPWHVYLATLMPIVAVFGIVLLAGSIGPGGELTPQVQHAE
jgi:MFS family permease